MNDRLLSIEEINQLILVTKAAKEIAYLCQLRDTIRENERLCSLIKIDAPHSTNCAYALSFPHPPCNCWKIEALSNKDSNNG